jgi:hypothetical protein
MESVMEKRKDVQENVEIKWSEFTSPEIARQLDLARGVLDERLKEAEAARKLLASMGFGGAEQEAPKRRGRPRKSNIVDADDLELVDDEDSFNGSAATEHR